MKKTILNSIAIIVITLFLGQISVMAQEVIFSREYRDIDTSKVSFSYERNKTFMEKGTAEELAAKILTYTGCKYNRDLDKGDETRLVYSAPADSAATLEINRETSAVVFNAPMKYYFDVKNKVVLPSEKDAPYIAKKHLKNLGLLPSEQISLVHVGGVGMAVVNEREYSRKYKRLATVIYGKEMDGIPVLGATRIVVNLGNNGELVTLLVNWPDIKEEKITKGIVKNTELRDYIIVELKKAYPGARSIEVKEGKLVQYNDGNGITEPAIVLLGEVFMPKASFPLDWLLPLKKDHRADYPHLANADVVKGNKNE